MSFSRAAGAPYPYSLSVFISAYLRSSVVKSSLYLIYGTNDHVIELIREALWISARG